MHNDYVNMHMQLDEEVDGTNRYSIIFERSRERDDNFDYKGGRAVAVYNDFYNSDGDIITKLDIIIDVIAFVISIIEIVLLIIVLKRITKENKNE